MPRRFVAILIFSDILFSSKRSTVARRHVAADENAASARRHPCIHDQRTLYREGDARDVSQEAAVAPLAERRLANRSRAEFVVTASSISA
jgi:hypothetical protein